MKGGFVAVVAVLLYCSGAHGFDLPLVDDIPEGTPAEAVVHIDTGTVYGKVNDSGRVFQGIPFAGPPTKQNRFMPPVPREPWYPQKLEAINFGPGCPQDCVLPPLTCPEVVDEDCLFLSVYTPRLDSITEPLPVMVFFPGGDYIQGTSQCLLYQGSALVNETNTILVVTNYRLGALGFLTNDELSGNYGQLDQVASLQWVQRNIAQFGGDPNRVTLFGQSAGGMSTVAHIVSPASYGLFQNGIVESNPLALGFNTFDYQKRTSDIFASSAGCGDLSGTAKSLCLRNLTADEVIAAQAVADARPDPDLFIEIFTPWTPIVDGSALIPGQPTELFRKGMFNPVNMMAGSVTDEAWMFIWFVAPFPIPAPLYDQLTRLVFGADADAVLEVYPVKRTDLDTRPELNDMLTDYLFLCPTRDVGRSFNTQRPELEFYKYRYNHVLSFYDAWGPDYEFCWFDYVCHAAELPFVFQTAGLGGFTYEADELTLSNSMIGYWANFAHSGTPNSGPGDKYIDVNWPQYTASGRMEMDLNLTIAGVHDVHADKCDFWDTIGYNQFGDSLRDALLFLYHEQHPHAT
eukprot:CAMPEP_0119122462 /NCGR_PEP_ID=MMETSP1310-20130426/2708_1 /TAXON_ID=464262 /ORGANISM="Genus nov. species nov., Strain RCC2339" /LENGTH=572 /DNA_ID=CAMNT_0007112119 /DNA_START=81 /DNA_END=1799 /DNA_ORIENTATION=+